jgi:hypothetical protein
LLQQVAITWGLTFAELDQSSEFAGSLPSGVRT